jgi:hypothetical protein
MTREQARRILSLWKSGEVAFSLGVINAALRATGDLQ